MNALVALISGIIMGLGLCISQMANPAKVIAFLDVFGNWDPSLALVMAGALFVSTIAFRFILKRQKPVYDGQFSLPDKKEVDIQLMAGSALFGVGWGLAGFCPGPAFASLAYGVYEPFIFVGSMLLGMVLHRIWESIQTRVN